MKNKILVVVISLLSFCALHAQTKEFKIYGSTQMDFMEHNETYGESWWGFEPFNNMSYYQTYYFYDSTNSNIAVQSIDVYSDLWENHIISSEYDNVNGYTKYIIHVTWHPENVYYYDRLHLTWDLNMEYYDKQGKKHEGRIKVGPPKASYIGDLYPDQVFAGQPLSINYWAYDLDLSNYFPFNCLENYYAFVPSFYWMKSTDGENWSKISSSNENYKTIAYTFESIVLQIKAVNSSKTYFKIVTYYDMGDLELNRKTEVESNIVTITADASTPLVPGNARFTSTNTTVCNEPLTQGAIYCTTPSGGYKSGDYSYQWQKSTDSLNWQDIPNAISTNYNCSQDVSNENKPLFYRCKINCGDEIVYSNTVTANLSLETKMFKMYGADTVNVLENGSSSYQTFYYYDSTNVSKTRDMKVTINPDHNYGIDHYSIDTSYENGYKKIYRIC